MDWYGNGEIGHPLKLDPNRDFGHVHRVDSKSFALNKPGLKCANLAEEKSPMQLHSYVRAYLCSVSYAALFLFAVHNPGTLIIPFMHLAAYLCMLMLLLLFLPYHDKIRESFIRIIYAYATLLSCWLPAIQSDGLPRELPEPLSESFRTTLFQRPPPRFA